MRRSNSCCAGTITGSQGRHWQPTARRSWTSGASPWRRRRGLKPAASQTPAFHGCPLLHRSRICIRLVVVDVLQCDHRGILGDMSDSRWRPSEHEANHSRAGHSHVGSRHEHARPDERHDGLAARIRHMLRPHSHEAAGKVDAAMVESARGAVPTLLPVRFPVPLAEPGVRLSTHRALHGSCRQAWFAVAQGAGIAPR
jgi:hypothetical protein